MSQKTLTSLFVGSSLVLIAALAIGSQVQARPAAPTGGMQMTDAQMKDQCKDMMEQKKKLAADVKSQDAELTELVAKMNRAPGDKQMTLMAAAICGVVGFVTLALGAIGIVNIMLVSVAERTREIGLRKALGATYKNILTQFFVEGAFLTVFSGGIGLLIATAFVTALAQLPAPQGFDTPRIVPMSALAAILSLAIAGIVAGIYPARKAALLAPVEAMRQE